MVYVIVLLGSFIGICAILGLRVLYRNRSVRKFVRSMRSRVKDAEQTGSLVLNETRIERPLRSPRASAVALQEVRSLMREAEKCLSQQKIPEAERLYIKALTTMPDADDVRANLAKLYLQTNREQKAVAIYLELLHERHDLSYFANLGLAYYRLGRYPDACDAYREAYDRDPNNPDRAAALGRACIADQRYHEAAPLLEKATQRLSRDVELLQLLGECYEQLSDIENAQLAYRRINKIEPYNEAIKAKLATLANTH